MSFHLSSSFDREKATTDFSSKGFARIRNVLSTESANRVHKALLESTPWNLVFNDGGKHIDLTSGQLYSMPKQSVTQLQQAIYKQAQSDFQYCYNNYPIFDAHKAGRNKDHVLHKFFEWMIGDEFLDTMRAITGYDDISFADAQATRYMPGHFLTTHDDTAEGKNRRAEYIFNFTPKWNVDWGGYLQLLDDTGDVRAGLRPSFNVLNVIAVPQKHNVSLVAPFSGGMRLSISGWLRHGDPE
ncbi:MAG: 2OG-Fe(II) oxygenase [Gammaproteobacteria bacterium]|nr:2OG-Fe(II) oxygenase [Gammaproteobacteria bacterium]